MKPKKAPWASLVRSGDIGQIQAILAPVMSLSHEYIRICVNTGETRNLTLLDTVLKFYENRKFELEEIERRKEAFG